MKKSKFKTLEDQKFFFNSVKKKLGIGARKLAKILKLNSRGSIESYTFGRTAPPLKIVEKLEELSGIKGDYIVVEGRVVRGKRKFLPLNPAKGKQNLKKRFSKDFDKIDAWIKSDLSLKDIVDKIRKRGYSFDNSRISKWLGAYRTSLKIRFKDEISPRKNEIVVRGRVRKDRGTYSIGFNLINISKNVYRRDFRIGLEFSKDRSSVRIFPLSFGRRFNVANTNVKILVTDKSGIKDMNYIDVILKPEDFGFSIKDSIYDIDAKVLVKPLLREGFILDNYRSTPANHKGDLSVFYEDVNYIIEITRAKTYHACYYKVGQSYIQKISWPNSKQIFVCDKNFLIPSAGQALRKLNVKIIEINFKEKWEQKVIQELKKDNLELAKTKLSKEGYRIVGGHSAVKICLWTKHALCGDRGCWKEKFYGISSAGCAQLTPSLFHCENKCLHCWRDLTYTSNKGIENPDGPKDILDGIVEARKKLLVGFKGNKDVDLAKLEEGLEPKLYTMSLSGEPTLYPRLGEMFKEIRRRGAVSFLVTNGLNSSVLENFGDDEMPTQITVSTNAPNEKLFNIWHRSSKKNAWKEFLKTLDVIKNLKGRVRRVIRMTLVDSGEEGKFCGVTNMLDENVSEYCDLIKRAAPDFVHVKGFKSVGYARARMGYDKQPWFDAVKDYALKICEGLDGYEIAAEDKRSCVVMLARDGAELRIGKC